MFLTILATIPVAYYGMRLGLDTTRLVGMSCTGDAACCGLISIFNRSHLVRIVQSFPIQCAAFFKALVMT